MRGGRRVCEGKEKKERKGGMWISDTAKSGARAGKDGGGGTHASVPIGPVEKTAVQSRAAPS